MRNQEGEIELQKKYIEEFVRGTSLFDCTPSFILYNFLLLSSSSPSPPHMMYLLNGPYKDDNAMVGILCDDTMSEQSKIKQSLAT